MNVIGGLLVAGVVFAVQWWWARRKRPARLVAEACVECAIADPKTGGPELRGREVHEVISRPDDAVEREFAGCGGTYTAVCYCKRHCPGGCENPRCRRRATLAA